MGGEMTFPSEAYKNLCIENAEKLREEWEPKPGDWAVRLSDKDKRPLILAYVHKHYFYTVNKRGQRIRIGMKDLYAPLPTPRQLWGMLEEKGCAWQIAKRFPVSTRRHPKGPFYRADVYYGPRRSKVTKRDGPDPETALLKALMEVMKDDTTLP